MQTHAKCHPVLIIDFMKSRNSTVTVLVGNLMTKTTRLFVTPNTWVSHNIHISLGVTAISVSGRFFCTHVQLHDTYRNTVSRVRPPQISWLCLHIVCVSLMNMLNPLERIQWISWILYRGFTKDTSNPLWRIQIPMIINVILANTLQNKFNNFTFPKHQMSTLNHDKTTLTASYLLLQWWCYTLHRNVNLWDTE